MTIKRHIQLGQQTAFISFLLGTVIFGLYFLSALSGLLFWGYGFILLAALVNAVIFISILLRAHKDRKNRKRLLITSGIMLLNIPIMLVYGWLTLILLNTMRITLTNHTATELTDIKIVGCGGGYINTLHPGERTTVWVDITGDCSIYLNYLSNGQRRKETVAGYVTSNMGQQINHKIDGKDKEYFDK